MTKKTFYIIDFDSTFSSVEALDVLAEISLKNHPEKKERLAAIKNLTDLGMEGKLDFQSSLEQRINLLGAKREHLQTLVQQLKKKVSTSFKRNRSFLERENENILIVSGGFKEFIDPVVQGYNIPSKNVYANTFLFDKEDNIIGFDTKNPLSKENGKVSLIKTLSLPGEVIVIGDGYTDFQLKLHGLAHKFYAFTENIERELVKSSADHVAPSFDEFLYVNHLPMALSYPKSRIRVFLLDEASKITQGIFAKEGFKVSQNQDDSEELRTASILVMSPTQKKISFEECRRLKVICVLGKAPSWLDLDELCLRGVVVFDDPKDKNNKVEFITKRVKDFINKGATYMSANIPGIVMDQAANTHRLLHLHANKPGMLAALNKLMAQHEMNIVGQYLRTNKLVGYVITDVDKKYHPKLVDDLKNMEGTISFRLIYK